MASQQNLEGNAQRYDSLGDVSLNTNMKPVSETSTGFSDCNICLDSARDPVVTLCGHLYCWPCIYKWLHVQTTSLESDKCPVCKTHISNSTLVPLYGRGNTPEPGPEPDFRRHQLGLVIPSRPSAPGGSVLQPGPFQAQPQAHMVNHMHPFGPTAPTSFSNPFVGMVGEMVCAMIFRSADSGFFATYSNGLYGPYQNTYPVSSTATGGPRVRRQVMQVEKSLNRLTIFFFCCLMLCLLLF